MAQSKTQTTAAAVWQLAQRQHGVVSRRQLLALGLHPDAIYHRLRTGRLHPVARGIYAVGRPELSRYGRWTAAVMSCGPEAALSHESAAALWGIRSREGRTIEVSIPPHLRRRRPGIAVHRRVLAPADRTVRHGVVVTTVHRTLIDLAQTLPKAQLEAAINAADKYDLTDPETLRASLGDHAGRKVDFYWPDLGLVVETDGLRYHRTPVQQARDRLRDQTHVAAGLTPLRFTHAQVRHRPRYVQHTLSVVAARLGTTG